MCSQTREEPAVLITFSKLSFQRTFGFGRDAAHATPDKFAAVAGMFNSLKHHAASLRREIGLGMWHSWGCSVIARLPLWVFSKLSARPRITCTARAANGHRQSSCKLLTILI